MGMVRLPTATHSLQPILRASGDAGNTVTLTLTVTSNNSCGTATANATYDITVYPLPVATITGDLSVCENSAGNIYTTESGMSNYAWTVSGGSVTSGGGSTDNSVTITWGPAGTGTVSVTYTNSNGCTADSPTAIQVGIDQQPQASAGGSQTICENQTATVDGASANNGNIQWTITSGNGTLTNSNTLTPTYTPGAGDAGNTVTLTLTVTSDNQCGTTASDNYTINVEPLPIATAGGSATICVNENATVSGASASNGTILWTVTSGNGSLTNETTLTPTYTPTAADAGTTVILTMTVTSDNSCGTIATDTYTIDVNSELPVSVNIVADANPVCDGTSVAFTATPTNGGSTPAYQWKVNGANVGTNSNTFNYTSCKWGCCFGCVNFQ